MANYREDFANINLETGTISRNFMNHSIGGGDALGDRFGVRVFRNGEAVTLGGTCAGYFVRNTTGETVVITGGVVSGNEAYVTLPAACYAVEGSFTLAIKVTVDSEIVTLRIVDGVVDRTNTSVIVDPGDILPSIEDLLQAIEDAVESIPADYSSLWASLAPPFSPSTPYKAGQHVTYDGKYWLFTTDHDAGAWNAAHVIQDNVGGELTDLKSALDDISENTVNLWSYGNLTGTKSVYGNVSLTTGKKYIISAKITSSYTGSLNNSRVSFFNDSSSEQDHGQIAHDGERHSCVLTATANTTRLFFFAANTSTNSTGYTVTVTDIQVEEQVEEDQDMTPYVPPVTATDFIARYSVGYYGVQTLTDTEKELARNNMGAASKDYADTLNSEIEDITEELEGDYSATIKEFTGCKPLLFSKGVYSTPSAGSESVKSAGGGNYVCMKEPVTEGDTITLNVKNDTSGYRAYALLDSTGKVVTLSDTPVSAKQIVTIPSGISYIVINNKLSLLSSGYYAYKGESLIERVSDISERTVNLWPHGDETFVKSLQNVPLSLPAGTYTLSAKITDSDPTIGTAKFYMHYVGGGSESKGITISEGRSKTSITLSEAIYKIRFDAAPTLEEADGVTSTWEDIQIEAGSKATDYVEYGYTAVDQCARNELVNTKGNIFGYKIAFFGDSITKGRDGNSSSTSPYPIPETVSKLLNIEAGNYGVGSIGWLEPVSEKTAYDIIAETDLTGYEYIVLCYGVNDTSSSYPVGSWDSTDETTIMGQVNKCVNYIYTQNNKAVVIIISPWNGFSYGSPPDYKYGSKMGSIANAEKQYCEYYNIPFIDQRSGPLNQWNMITTVSDGVITKAGLIGKDGVHPSNEGYKVLGSWIAGELSRLIR